MPCFFVPKAKTRCLSCGAFLYLPLGFCLPVQHDCQLASGNRLIRQHIPERIGVHNAAFLCPFQRQGGEPCEPLLHWGLYAYTRDFLQRFVAWPTGRLEACEKLEQLRALENGAKICVLTTTERTADVDVPEDIARVEELIRN